MSPQSGGALWEGLKFTVKHCNMQRTRPVQRRCWKRALSSLFNALFEELHIGPCSFLGKQRVGSGHYRLMLLCAVLVKTVSVLLCSTVGVRHRKEG